MMKYKLQFFADDYGVNEDPATLDSEDTEGYEEADDEGYDEDTLGEEIDYSDDSYDEEGEEELGEPDKPIQTPEENAKFAAIRRKYENQERQTRQHYSELDGMFAQQFGNWVNPVTGQPIDSAESYLQTLHAMQEEKKRQEMEDAGIDPDELDALIANNPAVVQANNILRQQQAMEELRRVDNEIAMINKLDPSIKTADDLQHSENFAAMDEYFRRGYSIYDSFRLANFDKLQRQSADAAKQHAINQAKSTSHLESTKGLSAEGGDTLAEIPKDELPIWKAYFPGLSNRELKKKYNSSTRS